MTTTELILAILRERQEAEEKTTHPFDEVAYLWQDEGGGG